MVRNNSEDVNEALIEGLVRYKVNIIVQDVNHNSENMVRIFLETKMLPMTITSNHQLNCYSQ
ncbi:MAG: hypothetical protein Q4D33_08615 [Prevotellaceae bacterium]|nr:hypothetical protein [Prevotellaceae bacterium]